ncbi:MAG: site-2 protease family protein [Clostridia bacterium]|nr:site-2 protease family protein [Clostridia bacterium]
MDFLWYCYSLLISFLAVVVVLTVHEFAHAFVAYQCGDPTPKWNGRLSFNPLRHFDPTGLVCFALVGFGWAKPVPINPDNFKHYRRGLAFTASAGIIVNYLTALLVYPLWMVCERYIPTETLVLQDFLSKFTYYVFAYSLSFCVFNLLPLYPLDGFRLVDALNRRRGKVYRFLRNYGYYILLGLIVESFICSMFVRFGIGVMAYFDILGWIMQFATGIIGWPISQLWGLIPW